MESVQLFIKKTETNLYGAYGIYFSLTRFCRLFMPKASSIRSDWTHAAF